MHKFLLFITLFLFLACSSEKPAEVGKQKSSEIEKGSVSAPPRPESKKTEAKEDSGKKNTLPELSRVKILPEVFKPGDSLYVEAAASDADGDDVTILYEWAKDSEPAGINKQIDAPVKRGDKVSIKLTPYDGKDYGKSIVLRREIGNLPPMIVEHKRFTFDGNVYAYQVNATDPDSDPLTYSLKTAPAGMTIEKITGLIKWDVPQDFKGKTEIVIVVSDGHGGEALQSFAFEIVPEK